METQTHASILRRSSRVRVPKSWFDEKVDDEVFEQDSPMEEEEEEEENAGTTTVVAIPIHSIGCNFF
jgi:hypothetical protein